MFVEIPLEVATCYKYSFPSNTKSYMMCNKTAKMEAICFHLTAFKVYAYRLHISIEFNSQGRAQKRRNGRVFRKVVEGRLIYERG